MAKTDKYRFRVNNKITYDAIQYTGFNLGDIYEFIGKHKPTYYIKVADIYVGDYFVYDNYDIVKMSEQMFVEKYKGFYRFSKKERSGFKYWFAHWCAFQMTALNLRAWKFKYLFHDLEKPFIKPFIGYPKTQRFHRLHNRHHLEYGLKHGWDKCDWEAMVIDWECSNLTKYAAQLDAREKIEYECRNEWQEYKDKIMPRFCKVLDKFNL